VVTVAILCNLFVGPIGTQCRIWKPAHSRRRSGMRLLEGRPVVVLHHGLELMSELSPRCRSVQRRCMRCAYADSCSLKRSALT
jgi:hypothetical protein